MLAIVLRFPGGRYHATPWGRHVNEADVEWPPSPWRLVRALMATWHRKADQKRFPEPLLEDLVARLSADAPVYALPKATHAHTRHYMPVREGKKDKPVLIFDAFVRVDPSSELVVVWPKLELNDDQRALLDALLCDMGFLGRAESWVEAWRLDSWDGEPNCIPGDLSLDVVTGEMREPVRLLRPKNVPAYQEWHQETNGRIEWQALKKKARAQLETTLPERQIDALRLETTDIQQAGWSLPPGGEFVTYQRPYDCFRPERRPRRTRNQQQSPITTARLMLSGKPLPRIEDAVKVGELVRDALMGVVDKRLKQAVPAVISGHGMGEGNRHGHAFYLPEDADGDGYIDHVLIHASDGLPPEALRAVDALTVSGLWRRGNKWQVLFEGAGAVQAFADVPYAGKGKVWRSTMPYLHPWHVKKKFTVEDQIRRECRARPDLPELVQLTPLREIDIHGRRRRPIHFHRFRNKSGLVQPDTCGSFWRLEFAESVQGPLALGFGCHFGLGVLVPE